MQRLFAKRSYFDYLIAVVTVIAIIFIFKELFSSGEDEKRYNLERSKDVAKFVIPPANQNLAPPKPVIVTQNVVVFKTVHAKTVTTVKVPPIKEIDEDVNPEPEKNAIVTHKVIVVKTVALKVTETAAVTEIVNQK